MSVALKTEFSPSKSASDVFNLTSFTLSESVILSFALTALIEIKIIKIEIMSVFLFRLSPP